MPKDNRQDRDINIHEHEIENMHPHSKITIIAKPGVGKSKLVNDITRYHRYHIPTGMYMSGTGDSTDDITGIFPEIFIHPKWDEEQVKSYINRQKLNKRNMDEGLSNGLLILEDITENRNNLKSKTIIGLFKMGRQWANMLLLILQNASDLPYEIRGMSDYTFIGREISKEKRDKLYDAFIPSKISRLDFDDLMDQCTEDHTFLVVNNRTSSYEIEDIIFWYKANPNLQPFQFGCEEIWMWDKIRLDKNYKEREDEEYL